MRSVGTAALGIGKKKPGKLTSTVSGGAPTACSTMEIEPVSGGTVNTTLSPTVCLPSRGTRGGGREEPATGARQAAGADAGPTTPPLRRPTCASGGRQPNASAPGARAPASWPASAGRVAGPGTRRTAAIKRRGRNGRISGPRCSPTTIGSGEGTLADRGSGGAGGAASCAPNLSRMSGGGQGQRPRGGATVLPP